MKTTPKLALTVAATLLLGSTLWAAPAYAATGIHVSGQAVLEAMATPS
jgi:hypothetical protein